MEETGCKIRTMTRKEVDIAIEWAAAEGWNPGLRDADSFYAADPNGFFIAELNGEPAGCISAVAYDDSFGFMGFYIVRKDLRKQGIGMALWETAIKYMGTRTIGGDGVVSMVNKYVQCGFQIGNYNARYEGIGMKAVSQLTDLCNVPFAELARFDRRFFPAPRNPFLKTWISQAGGHSLAVMDGSRLTGYGVIRPCFRGFKIAPIFAETPAIAEKLFTALASFADGKSVFLDIPVSNREAMKMVERHTMTKVFETVRIYKGAKPVLPLEHIYGITSFELG